MASRSQRERLASQTVSILKSGHYQGSTEEEYNIHSDVENSMSNTKLYSPKQLQELIHTPSFDSGNQVELEVTGEGCVSAARRLGEMYDNVTLLNFASAKNPCGGMLGGSRAQEESIGVCSGLHSCLTLETLKGGYYNLHRFEY